MTPAINQFNEWLQKAGYITATSDMQLALFEAWCAGRQQRSNEIAEYMRQQADDMCERLWKERP